MRMKATNWIIGENLFLIAWCDMLDVNKLKSAKYFIDNLANGNNPFGGEALPEGDIVNDVRSVRWLFYISGVIDEIITL